MDDTPNKFDPVRHLDAMAQALQLPVTPEQRVGVLQFLQVAYQMSEVVRFAPIAADTCDLAPVYRPGSR
jgi:hypothetical protein